MALCRNDDRLRRHQAVLEPLEARRLLADTLSFSLFPTPGMIYGPLPVISHVKAPDAAISVRRVASTKSDQISVVDVTFADNHPQFDRGYWGGEHAWSNPQTGQFDDSQQQVELMAKYARDGGTDPWNHWNLRPNSTTVMDFESPRLSTKPASYLAERARWFKQAAPNAPLTNYWPNIGWGNFGHNEFVADPTPAQYQSIVAVTRSYAPLVNQLDAISACLYMLDPANVDREFKAFATVSHVLRTVYPTKPIMAFVWGAYHTSWNPPNSVLPDAVMRRYVDMIRTYYDGAIVWGTARDNAKLLSMLNDPANRTRLKTPLYHEPGTSAPIPVTDSTGIPIGDTVTGDTKPDPVSIVG